MSYINIGGLPSGFRFYDFETLEVRPLLVSDMQNVDYIKVFKRPLDVFLLLSNVLRLDSNRIWQLTRDDCIYILTYLRRISYTDAPITVTWDCGASVVNERDKRLAFRPEHLHSSDSELKKHNLVRRSCGRKNSELIYPHMMDFALLAPDWSSITIPDGLKVPRLHDMHLLEEACDEVGAKLSLLRDKLIYVQGDTLQDRLDYIGNDLSKLGIIEQFAQQVNHGIRLSYNLRCFDCNHSPKHSKDVDLADALPSIDETSLMNMQYTIMIKFNVQIDEATPVKKLLYWHSAYQKDKQEAAAKKPKKGR